MLSWHRGELSGILLIYSYSLIQILFKYYVMGPITKALIDQKLAHVGLDWGYFWHTFSSLEKYYTEAFSESANWANNCWAM